MRRVIEGSEKIRDDTRMKSHGVTAAGALGSLLLGTVTGGVGLAAAGFVANEAITQEDEDARSVASIAAQRRGFMVGIYNAKGCNGPIEHVMIDRTTRDNKTRVAELEERADRDMNDVSPAAGGQETPAEMAADPARYNQ